MESEDAASARLARALPLILVLSTGIAWICLRGWPGAALSPRAQPVGESSASARLEPALLPAPARLRGGSLGGALTAPGGGLPAGGAVPEASVTFEGTILDDATGGGVPDIRIVSSFGPRWARDPATGETAIEPSTYADRDGHWKIVVPASTAARISGFRVEDSGWQVVRWRVEEDPTRTSISGDVEGSAKRVMWLQRTFHLRGLVEDAGGHPLAGIILTFGVAQFDGETPTSQEEQQSTGADGRFDMGPFLEPEVGAADASRTRPETSRNWIHAFREGFAVKGFDPWSVAPAGRDDVRLVLGAGHVLAGVLVDTSGRPLSDAVVALEYGDDWNLRRGARTDTAGRWRLEQLTPGAAVLVAHAFGADAKARRELVLEADDLDVRLVAQPVRLSRPHAVTTVLGMQLAEVDDELRVAYDVPEQVYVLILDPGPEADALGFGRLEKGNGLCVVGERAVSSVRETVEALIEQARSADVRVGVRVVYRFWDEHMNGTNVDFVKLGPQQRASLEAPCSPSPSCSVTPRYE